MRFLLPMLISLVLAAPSLAQPVPVRIASSAEGYQLLREGQPYFIRGAGGDASKPLLRAMGGNSFRTWGVEDLGRKLDEVQHLGLTVTAGIWLEHASARFSYANADQVAQQYARARSAIDAFRNHPALLMWGVGNEMEMGQEDNPAMWAAVEQIAAYAKRVDPHHPTMVVVAEVGPKKLAMIAQHCPSIDVVGINTYGGGPSVGERYRASGGTRPYVVAEFGPAGPWEVEKTPWGAAYEASSTDKPARYRDTYEKSILHQPLSLGAYTFLWGHKQEATATWFGLFWPDGTRTAAADLMGELWSGRPAAHPAPRLTALRLDGSHRQAPGSMVRLTLETAPGTPGDALRVQWVVQHDPQRPEGDVGDGEPVPAVVADAVVRGDLHGADIRLPAQAGAYRLFAYVRDHHGGGAVANVPVLVEGAQVR